MTVRISPAMILCVILSSAVSSARADEISHVVFEMGVRIGYAESGAERGDDPQSLMKRLESAREFAVESGCVPTEELDSIIARMKVATDSRSLHAALVEYRREMARHALRHWMLAAKPVFDASDWEGTWDTNWNRMTLQRQPDGTISGFYNTSNHAISGTVDPDHPEIFSGTWTHAGSTLTGRFLFRMTEAGQFEGVWTGGDADPAEGGSPWTGKRRDIHPPEEESPNSARDAFD